MTIEIVRSEYGLRSRRTKQITRVFQSRAMLEEYMNRYSAEYGAAHAADMRANLDIVRITTSHELME